VAASAWEIFNVAKHKIGAAGLSLSGATFRMSLHRSSASTNLTGAITIFSSIGDECSGGGYSAITLSGVTWTAGASAGQQAWDVTDPVFTASASTLSAVRFAVVRTSGGAGSGIPLCFAALSTAEFDVTTGNTLTVQMAATGVFTLA
jgi:hypothetical protein